MNDHPLVGIWPLKQAGPGRVINPYTRRAIKVGGATHTSVVQQLSVSANNPPVAAPTPKEKKLRKKPQLKERARPKKVKLAERMQAAEDSRAGPLKGRGLRPRKVLPTARTGDVSAIDARMSRAEENRQEAATEKAARLEQAATRRAQAQAYRAEIAEMQQLAPPVLPPPPQAALWGTLPAAARPSFNTRNLAAEERRRAALEQKRGKARARTPLASLPAPAQAGEGSRQQAAAERRAAVLAEKKARARVRPRPEVQPMDVDGGGRLYAAELRRQGQAARERTRLQVAAGKREKGRAAAEKARDLEADDLVQMMMALRPLDPPRTIHKVSRTPPNKSSWPNPKAKAAGKVPGTNKRKTRESQLMQQGSPKRRYTSTKRQTALESGRLEDTLRGLVGRAEAEVHAVMKKDPALLDEYYVKLDELQHWINQGVQDTQTKEALNGRLHKVMRKVNIAQVRVEEEAKRAKVQAQEAQEGEQERQRQAQEADRRGHALLQEIRVRTAERQEDYDRKNARHKAEVATQRQAAAEAERQRQLELAAAEQAATEAELARNTGRVKRRETAAAAARGMVGTARAVTGGVRQAGPLVAGAASEAARGLSSAATAAGGGVREAMPAMAAGVAGAAKGVGATAGRKKAEVMQVMQGARASIGSAARKAAWRLFPNPQDWHATAYGSTQATTQDAGPSEQLGHVSRTSTFNEKQNVEDVLGPALKGPGPPMASAEPVDAARTLSGAREGYPELYSREERPVNRTFKEDWELNELRKAKEKRAKDKKLAWEAEQEAEKAAMEAQRVADYWQYTYPDMIEMERDEREREHHEQSLLREMERDRQRAAVLQRPSPYASPYAVLFEPSSVQQTAGNKRPQSPDAEWRKPESRVPGMRSESRSMSRGPAPPKAGAAPVNFFP